jgi:putative membrane protein insertion efficiency factor
MTLLAIRWIRWYQVVVSPRLQRRGVRCRFWPSCSQYAVMALEKHGFITGARMTVGRLLRCRPSNHASCIDVP